MGGRKRSVQKLIGLTAQLEESTLKQTTALRIKRKVRKEGKGRGVCKGQIINVQSNMCCGRQLETFQLHSQNGSDHLYMFNATTMI
jgi:hypothetical protein